MGIPAQAARYSRLGFEQTLRTIQRRTVLSARCRRTAQWRAGEILSSRVRSSEYALAIRLAGVVAITLLRTNSEPAATTVPASTARNIWNGRVILMCKATY